MARADLLVNLVRAGSSGDRALFRKTLEALIADERGKQHNVLADRLSAHLNSSNLPNSLNKVPPEAAYLLYEVHPQRRLESLILPDSVVTACKELIEEQHRAELLRSHNLEPRHRVLLAGPPGNGKTSLAEVIAAELMVPLLVVRYEAIIASYLGETALRLARLFDHVRTCRAVLFFDEFDVVGKERGDEHETGEIKRVVSSLLLQVDALPSHVVVVVATNHPELLDRAVWRRFQLRLHLPAPNPSQVEEWFRRLEEQLGTKLGSSPRILAQKLKGLNFSELEEFRMDVQRRYTLALPEADVRRIVDDCLRQWKQRFSLDNKGE
jgi:SpoVK/Ycf46/Vps4 family AAA+-type ATPase